jgi:hypothetical protein
VYLPVKNIVNEIDLKPDDAFLPLFECVVNSIISLKQTNIRHEDKKIQIQITRGDLPQIPQLLSNTKTIDSVKVIDNGEGFNDKNFKSFDTAYTDTNKIFGCKGIGRFTVLAGFKKIIVQSWYNENGKTWYREFTFEPETEVIELKNERVENQTAKTIVEFSECHSLKIKDSTAISVQEIAELIMQHCLVYYLCNELPRIEILDKETNEIAVVNELYDRLSKEREKEFPVRSFNFHCYVTKEEKVNNRKNHYIHYCANSRMVGYGKSLSKVNSLYAYPIIENGKSYFLDVFVVSNYLNQKVYATRNGFSIPQEKDNSLFAGTNDEITFQEIEEILASQLATEYDSYVKETQERNKVEVINYIQRQAPRYMRYLHNPEILNSIPPNLSDDKKEEFLYKVSYQEGKSIDKRIQKIIEKQDISEENIQDIIIDIKNKTVYDKDSLTDYMFKRKAIIDLFKKFLEADASGKYKLEQDIHNLIMPMGVTHQEIDYETHNLWLLDDRFATYGFIGSDQPITTFSQKKSRKEADIIMIDTPKMFDNPIGFASNPSGELSSMVIFEFKRPGETAHQKNKKNFRWEFSELVEKYFDDFIYSDDKKNYRGRTVILNKDTPKFGYVIVDVIPPKLKEYNESRGYKKTPFGTYYKINPDLNLHIEVVTFEQLIRAVETRHAPFFDKLFNGHQPIAAAKIDNPKTIDREKESLVPSQNRRSKKISEKSGK